MKIVCPHCGVKGSLADSFIHNSIRCPRCKQIFRVEVEVQFAPLEESASPAAANPPLSEPSPPSGPMDRQMLSRPERVVMPPNVKLNAEPLGEIRREEAPVATDALYSEETEPVVPQIVPQVVPQVILPMASQAIPQVERDVTEDQVQADLDTLFERKLLCAGCGRQAGNDEEFSPGRAGLVCPTCRAAEESADNFARPTAAKPVIDWGAVPAASDWQHEDGLRAMAADSKRRAIGPNARFTVFQILKEAWEKLKGVKRDVWGATAIIVLVNLIFGAIVHFVPDANTEAGAIVRIGVSIIVFLLNGLLLSGLSYLGLCRARGEEGGWDTMFVSFSPINLVKLLLLFILLPVIIGLGTVCLLVPGIYLATTLSFSPLLALDHGMWPWQAILESRRESHANCLNIFLLYLAVAVTFGAATLLLLVGLFWMLPLAFVAHGVIYRRLFDGV